MTGQDGTPSARALRSFFGPALGLAVCGLAAGWAVRFGIIEPPPLSWACQVADRPWWCPARQALIEGLQAHILGWVALAAGLAAVFGGRRLLAGIAAALGAAGLILYAAGPGAAALLLGLLRSLRL